MMKRTELMKQLKKMAKARGEELEITEGGNHTKVRIGNNRDVVPRHAEINELTAKGILKQMGEGK